MDNTSSSKRPKIEDKTEYKPPDPPEREMNHTKTGLGTKIASSSASSASASSSSASASELKKFIKKVINFKKALTAFGADTKEINDYIKNIPIKEEKEKATKEYETFKIFDEKLSKTSIDEFKQLNNINNVTSSSMSSAPMHTSSSSMSSTMLVSNSSMSSAPMHTSSSSMSSTMLVSNSPMVSEYDDIFRLPIGDYGKTFKNNGVTSLFPYFIDSVVHPDYHLCGLDESKFTKSTNNFGPANYEPGNYEPQYCDANDKIYDKANGRVPYYPIPHISPSTSDNPHKCIFGITGHGGAKAPTNQNQIFNIENGPNLVHYFAAAMGNALAVATLDDIKFDTKARHFSPPVIDTYVQHFVAGCDKLTHDILNPQNNNADSDFMINVERKKTVYSYKNAYLNKIYNMNDNFSSNFDKLSDLQKMEFTRDFFANNFNFGLILYANTFGIPSGTRINIEVITDARGDVSVQDILNFIIQTFQLQSWDTVCLYDKTCNPVIRGSSDRRQNRLVSRHFDNLIEGINSESSFIDLFKTIVLPDIQIIVSDIKFPVNETQKQEIIEHNLAEYLKKEPVDVQKMLLDSIVNDKKLMKNKKLQNNIKKAIEKNILDNPLLESELKPFLVELKGGSKTKKQRNKETKKQKTKKQRNKKQKTKYHTKI